MKKFLLLLITLNFGCANKYNLDDNDKKKLNKEIDSIYELDQSIRLSFFEIDSTYELERFFHMKPRVDKVKILGETYNEYQNKLDSLEQIMVSNDFSNTKKLIEITKEYGFPSEKRLGVYKAKAYMILVHSPREYFDEIVRLVHAESEEGRISDYQKEYILWHINGRNGMPPMMGKNGEVIWN